jgi:hypothetical protein
MATLTFLFDLAKGAPERAATQIRSLQGRVTAAFSAATVLIGFAAFVTMPGSHLTRYTLAGLALAALAYALVAAVAVVGLRPSGVWGTTNPEKLWTDYAGYPVPAIQRALMAALARDWKGNAEKVRSAEQAARWAVRFVAVEGLAIATALLLARVS